MKYQKIKQRNNNIFPQQENEIQKIKQRNATKLIISSHNKNKTQKKKAEKSEPFPGTISKFNQVIPAEDWR